MVNNTKKYGHQQNRCCHITLQELLNLIAHKTNCQPRLYSNGHLVRCPSHNDKHPSLSVTKADDSTKLLIRCFAGCAVQEVCNSIGIEVKQLFTCKDCYGK